MGEGATLFTPLIRSRLHYRLPPVSRRLTVGWRLAAACCLLLLSSVALAQSNGEGGLPRDIHPDSRNRLAPLKAGVSGIDAIRLHASGVDVRWQSPLGRQLTELAILTSAREHDQPYEWSLHEM